MEHWGIFIIVIICLACIGIWAEMVDLSGTQRKEIEAIQKAASVYKKELGKKRSQLITKDDYGDTDKSKWQAEMSNFFKLKLAKQFPKTRLSSTTINMVIDELARQAESDFLKTYQFNESMDGIEYEHYCADLLRKNGWEASVSQASGDQGVDILARKRGTTVAIQCKKYSKPVGNKAIQEVASGKIHYRATHAAVVTNNSYTPSGKQLAKSNGVLLLHHSDLVNLDALITKLSK